MANGFLRQAITYEMIYSVGVFYKEWLKYFDLTASFLSLVGSAPTSLSSVQGVLKTHKKYENVLHAHFSGPVFYSRDCI